MEGIGGIADLPFPPFPAPPSPLWNIWKKSPALKFPPCPLGIGGGGIPVDVGGDLPPAAAMGLPTSGLGCGLGGGCVCLLFCFFGGRKAGFVAGPPRDRPGII